MPQRLSLERSLLRLALNLPGPLRGLLASRPRRTEGVALDPEIQLMLRLRALAPRHDYDALSPDKARALFAHEMGVVAPMPTPMAQIEDLSVPGPAGTMALRRYRPAGPLRGQVLYLHGGGFTIGDIPSYEPTLRAFAAAAGLQVLSLDYRLGPEHRAPAAAEDALAALRWTLANRAALGVEGLPQVMGGDSAGGNLTTVACRLQRERQPDGPLPDLQLLIYPGTDFAERHPSRHALGEGLGLTGATIDYFMEHYLGPSGDPFDPVISPLRAEDLSGLPPALMAIAGFDPLRDEGRAYAERLRAADVAVTVLEEPTLIHGWFNYTGLVRSCQAARDRLVTALNQQLDALKDP